MPTFTSAVALAAPVCLALLAGGVSTGARQQPASPERGIDLLGVDFVAVTKDGVPVDDLTAADVAVRIGGGRRTVRSLQRITVADAAPGAGADSPPLPAPFGSNAETRAGRALVVIVDDDSFRTGREAPLREAVDRFIAQLSPRDRLSLVTMPYGGVKVPLTTEHARVRTALSLIVGQASGDETGSDLACRTGRTLETLVGYLESAHGIRDTPVTIMFITGGLAAPRRDAPVTMAPGMCELQTNVFAQVGVAAGAARAQFYVIQLADMMEIQSARGDTFAGVQRSGATSVQRENIAGTGFLGSDNPLEGIEHLAGVTGGKMLQLTGSAEGALGRALRESTSYYLASIDPERSDRSGRSQQLEVRVSRPGVEIRSRPHITFARRDSTSLRPANPSPRDMIRVPDVFRGLPLRAAAYSAVAEEPGQVRVVTVAEPADEGTRFASLVAALFDRDGRLVTNWVATPADLARSTVVGAMPAEPGAYRLRVAAIDTTGRAGTADYEVTAEVLEAGPLKISSLVLGLSRNGVFVPRLQFGEEPVAIAQIEIVGAPPGSRMSAALELAGSMHGPPLVTVPLAFTDAGGTRYIASGAVPVGSLPPGDYIVRALVGLEGKPIGRVVRTLRKR